MTAALGTSRPGVLRGRWDDIGNWDSVYELRAAVQGRPGPSCTGVCGCSTSSTGGFVLIAPQVQIVLASRELPERRPVMNDNVIPFPGDGDRPQSPHAVSCPTNALVTYLTLLDGRVVHECHETLSPDLPSDLFDGYEGEDSCARLERRFGYGGYPRQQMPGPPEPTLQQITDRKLSALREFVGGEASLTGLDDLPLRDADDLRICSQRPWMLVSHEVDALVEQVAQQWFDDETLVALQRAMLLTLDQQEPCIQQWSAALTVGATAWAVGKANGLFGPQRMTQREVLHSIGIETWVGQQGATVAQLLRRGTSTAPPVVSRRVGPWGYVDPGPAHTFQKLTPLGRPELLLGATRSLVIGLRDRLNSE